MTDVSKGAMAVKKAEVNRSARFARWADLLGDELRLMLKPDAHVIALGKSVSDFLKEHDLAHHATCVLHYSPIAGAKRNAEVKNREDEFRAFSEEFSIHHLVEVAAEVMRDNSIPAAISEITLTRIGNSKLSESRKK